MDQRLFIYTRLYRQDYHLVYCPNNSFMPNDVKSIFKDFVREVINEDRITNGKIEEARWSFYRKGEYLLYGIGCRNVLLSDESNDYVGTPIRGFFGQVIKLDGSFPIELYLNVDSYKRIYQEKIVPIFRSNTSADSSDIDCPLEWLTDAIRISPQDNMQVVNPEKTKTYVFSDTLDMKEIAVSLAFGDKDTNFVFHLNNEGHIKHNRLCHFYNATIIGNENPYIVNTDVETNDEEVKNDNDSTNEISFNDKNDDFFYRVYQGGARFFDTIERKSRRNKEYFQKKAKELSQKRNKNKYSRSENNDNHTRNSEDYVRKAYPTESGSNESDWLEKLQSKYNQKTDEH